MMMRKRKSEVGKLTQNKSRRFLQLWEDDIRLSGFEEQLKSEKYPAAFQIPGNTKMKALKIPERKQGWLPQLFSQRVQN